MPKPFQPLVSIVVPTRNSAPFLRACLKSILAQTYPRTELIVVDRDSTDATKAIAAEFTPHVLNYGPERSAQRNFGVEQSKGEYVLIIDSDMELGRRVVEQCVTAFQNDPTLEGVIIHEESFGEGFWAQCKRLERSFYVGVSWIEAARCFKRATYKALGGYNTELVSGEDWDLSHRAEALGPLTSIDEFIRHNEGRIRLWGMLKKKYYYAQHARAYLAQNPVASKLTAQVGPLQRYKLFFSRPAQLFREPVVGLGMLVMKTCEFGAGGVGYYLSTVTMPIDIDKQKILLLSRPFINSNRGTGEQAVAREIYNELSVRSAKHIDKVAGLIPPYGAAASIVYYDYIVMLLLALKNLYKPHDVIILNSPFQASYIKLLKMSPSQIVCVVHDFFYLENGMRGMFDKYASHMYRKAILKSDRVITTTTETAEICMDKFGVMSTVAPLGVSKHNNHQPSTKVPEGIIGYIGSYVDRKRPELLLQLARENSSLPLTLRLAGRVPPAFASDAQIVGGKLTQMEIMGELTEEEKIKFYTALSFFYFPTVQEGFGLPLIEAMRYCVLPIVHEDANIPKIVKSRCTIIKSTREVPSIIKKYMASPKEYNEKISANYKYSARFDWGLFVDKLLLFPNTKQSTRSHNVARIWESTP